VKFVADPVPARLEVTADNTSIGSADPVRVMVRALDQAGNKLPFFPEPVAIEVTGAAKLLGPELVPLRAGSTGFWVEATGAGPIGIKVTNDRLGTTAIELTAA
jgi:beta-galactosidase